MVEKMSLLIEYDSVLIKYNEIWNKIKNTLYIKFHGKPVFDEKYTKAKVKIFNGVINTVFSDDEIPKESIHYICIAALIIDSVVKASKKTILKFI